MGLWDSPWRRPFHGKSQRANQIVFIFRAFEAVEQRREHKPSPKAG